MPMDINRLKLQSFHGIRLSVWLSCPDNGMWETPPSGGVVLSHESQDNYNISCRKIKTESQKALRKSKPTAMPMDINRLKLQSFHGIRLSVWLSCPDNGMWETPPSGGVVLSHESQDNYNISCRKIKTITAQRL